MTAAFQVCEFNQIQLERGLLALWEFGGRHYRGHYLVGVERIWYSLSRAPRLIVYVRVYEVMRGAAIQSLHVFDGSMVLANSPLKCVKHKLEQEL